MEWKHSYENTKNFIGDRDLMLWYIKQSYKIKREVILRGGGEIN
jgi:hypothetical protein